MFPDVRVELLVARCTFASHVNPQYPLIGVTRKKHSPGGSLSNVREWLDHEIIWEKAQLPGNTIVKYADYRISSGDPELFTAAGHRYEKILLLIGKEYTHWNFYQPNLPIQQCVVGRASLPISFCVCCFHMQYAEVLKTIKKLVHQPVEV